MLIVGLHYVGLDVIHELILGDTLPPLPHMQSSQITQHSNQRKLGKGTITHGVMGNNCVEGFLLGGTSG